MNKISDVLLNALSEDLTITIAPDTIHFQRKEEKLSIKTVVHVSFDEKKPIVVGVGDELSTSAAKRSIELFKHDSWNQLTPTKKDVLSAFFKHGIRKINNNRKVMIRPKIIVKNAKSLEKIFCGYQNDLLNVVLTESGAREIIFES